MCERVHMMTLVSLGPALTLPVFIVWVPYGKRFCLTRKVNHRNSADYNIFAHHGQVTCSPEDAGRYRSRDSCQNVGVYVHKRCGSDLASMSILFSTGGCLPHGSHSVNLRVKSVVGHVANILASKCLVFATGSSFDRYMSL